MLSAFGIDHGEIAKGRFLRPKKLTKAQIRTAGQGAPTRTESVKAGLNRIGEADVSLKGIGSSLSGGFGRTSSFMARHPGLTGTAAVGGGGAAGYKLLSDREPKRKRKAE
jgi:hypothetical protein